MFLIFGWSRFGGAPKEHVNWVDWFRWIDCAHADSVFLILVLFFSFCFSVWLWLIRLSDLVWFGLVCDLICLGLLTDWLLSWLMNWSVAWLVDWLMGLTVCLIDLICFDLVWLIWLIDRLINWLFGRLVDRLIHWLAECLIFSFIDSLVHCFLTDWLIVWFVASLFTGALGHWFFGL